MASARTCPHGEADRVLLSGTKLRKLLSENQPVPDHFSRPEVLAVLQKYYQGIPLDQRVEVKLSGHSAK
jgi:sulfate adenylyltransferase